MIAAFQTVLSTTVVMGILTLVFAGLSPVLGKRYHAKSLYGACIALMIGFLIPFGLLTPAPIVTAHVPAFLSQAVLPQDVSGVDGLRGDGQGVMQGGARDVAQTGAQGATGSQSVLLSDTQDATDAQGAVPQTGVQNATDVQNASQSPMSQAATLPVAAPVLTWQALLGFVWLAGAVLTLAVQLIRHMLFLRTVRRWQKPMTDEATLALFTREKQAMGIKARVQLLLCPSVNSPMMIGLLRPRLLLPDTDLTADELPLVFRHELTHLKRRDLWLKAAMLLARCVHWFNPAVYLLGRTFSFWQEASCDERVTCAATLEARQFYSETIIRIIRRQARLKTAVSTSFYGGRNGMKRRIVAIMEGGRRGGAFIGLVALVLTVGLSMAFAVGVSPEPSADVSPTATTAVGETYYVAREDASGVPLLSVPSVNDLNSPMIVYLNGTPVRVMERRASSSLPEWNEPDDAVNWARVQVEGDGVYSGYEGWMPLRYLATSTSATLPTATVGSASITGHETLYMLNTDDATPIGALPSGQSVTLLGIAQEWYHIVADGTAGFVRREALQLDGDAAAPAAPYLNAHFDGLTRDEYTAMTTFAQLLKEKSDLYGTEDPNEWSLEDKAWYSELRKSYFGDEIPYFQLPQEGDLQQDAAVDIAWQTFISYHATPTADQSDYTMNLAFCCEPAYDGVSKEWNIAIKPNGGESWFRIEIASPSGEITQITPMQTEASPETDVPYTQALAEWETARGPYDLWSPEYKAAFSKRYGDGSVLVPDSSALSKAEAISIARKALVERGDATQADADAYQVGLEYQYAGEGERTWRVAFFDANGVFVTDVLLDAFTGEIIHSTVTPG